MPRIGPVQPTFRGLSGVGAGQAQRVSLYGGSVSPLLQDEQPLYIVRDGWSNCTAGRQVGGRPDQADVEGQEEGQRSDAPRQLLEPVLFHGLTPPFDKNEFRGHNKTSKSELHGNRTAQ
jgi:hypothetical protein